MKGAPGTDAGGGSDGGFHTPESAGGYWEDEISQTKYTWSTWNRRGMMHGTSDGLAVHTGEYRRPLGLGTLQGQSRSGLTTH